MYLGQMTIWGWLLVVLLLLVAGALLWLVDSRFLKKMPGVHVSLPKLSWKIWLVVAASMLVVGLLTAGCMVLSLHGHRFFLLLLIVFCCLLLSAPKSMEAYLRSLTHTEAHRRYLLANGASHLESIIPSVRRALRAALLPLLWQRTSAMPLAMLMLMFGLKICSATWAAAIVTAVMTWIAVLAASVLAAVLQIWLADRLLFGKRKPESR